MTTEQIQKAVEHRIALQDGIDVSIDGKRVRIKGPKGETTKDFSDPRYLDTVSIEKSGSEIVVRAANDSRKIRSICGTISAHIRNMMTGVTTGYKYTMKIFYTHFPISITVKDKEAQIRNFIGEKSARVAEIVGNIQVNIDKDEVVILGSSIEDVGQTAANIEQACKLSRRDRRIFQDGIYTSGKFLQTGEKIR